MYHTQQKETGCVKEYVNELEREESGRKERQEKVQSPEEEEREEKGKEGRKGAGKRKEEEGQEEKG